MMPVAKAISQLLFLSLFLSTLPGWADTATKTDASNVESTGTNGASANSNTRKPNEPNPEDEDPTLTLEQARAYMLSLINQDRAKFQAAPVALDDAANRAAQLHANAMAEYLTNSHWHTDGTKPPQRYNECGGTDYVGENSHGCIPVGFPMHVAKLQLFAKEEMRDEERCFFDELPPDDGHRRNILAPVHTHVGIGLALVDVNDRWGITRKVVSAQEFVNKYGNFSVASLKLVRGQKFTLTGTVNPGYKVKSLNVCREELPVKISLLDLQDSRARKYHGSYTIAKDVVTTAWTNRSPTAEASLVQNGQDLQYVVVPSASWKSGLYYLYLWASPEDKDIEIPISLITARLE